MWLPAPAPRPMSFVCPPSLTAAHPLRCASSFQLRQRPTRAAVVPINMFLDADRTFRRGRSLYSQPQVPSSPLSFSKDALHSQDSHSQQRALILSVRRQPVACGAYNVSPTGEVQLLELSGTASSELRKPAISATGVCVAYPLPGGGLKQVLNGASLEVPRGQLHVLLGPNGCGKSTMLRVLGGLLRPQAGNVRVDAPVGFVFQNPDHQVVMPSVAADVAFGLGRYKLRPEQVRAAVRHALERVGLADFAERPSHTLSGGQKQRVAIAGVLAQQPAVLLLDELTTFLDGDDQMAVLRTVRELASPAGGVTALWVTHRLEELEYADSASYIDDGKVQVTGSPEVIAMHLRKLGAKM